uniref:Uncharacterized protein n=1 Tax=Cacopsylla melanoneura TaxID=428564 RepID=A0A8D9A5G5_9HEMI
MIFKLLMIRRKVWFRSLILAFILVSNDLLVLELLEEMSLLQEGSSDLFKLLVSCLDSADDEIQDGSSSIQPLELGVLDEFPPDSATIFSLSLSISYVLLTAAQLASYEEKEIPGISCVSFKFLFWEF